MGLVSSGLSEQEQWTAAPAGSVLAAFSQHLGRSVTVREHGKMTVISTLSRIELAYRPLWG